MEGVRRLSVGSVAAWAIIAASYVLRMASESWAAFELRLPWSRVPPLIRYFAYTAGIPAVAAVILWRRLGERAHFGLEPPRARPDLYLQSFALYAGVSILGVRGAELWAHTPWLETAASYGAPFLALAWPLVRGVRWRDLMGDLGFCRGRGVRRESSWGSSPASCSTRSRVPCRW